MSKDIASIPEEPNPTIGEDVPSEFVEQLGRIEEAFEEEITEIVKTPGKSKQMKSVMIEESAKLGTIDDEEDPDLAMEEKKAARPMTFTSEQIREILKLVGHTSNASETTKAPATTTISKKSLSKWAIEGLDLGDSGFSKLHSKESKFDGDKLYDLDPETFLSVRNLCHQKVKKIHATEIFTVTNGLSSPDFEKMNVITQYPKIKESEVEVFRDIRWPSSDPDFSDQSEMDQFTDSQIKASVFGSYLHSMLTEAAQRKLQADKDFYTVMDSSGGEYIDGPSFYLKVARIVDPNNMHLIETMRSNIKKMDVKDYGYSAKAMLTEFKNQQVRLEELGDTYSDSDKFRDLFQMLKTVKEKQFKDYVKKKRDEYYDCAESERHKAGQFDTYVDSFRRKETTMRNDGEWNKPSEDEAMVVALISHVLGDKKSTGDKGGSNKNSNKQGSNKKKKVQKEKGKYPEWKLEKPKDDSSTTKEKDGRTYHWCTKCRDGNGLWALHKTEEHKTDFKPKGKSTEAASAPSKKKNEKKQSSEKGQIKVSKDLMKSAKAYLARFKDEDFQ